MAQQNSYIKVRELYPNKLPITTDGDRPDELVLEQDITRKINPLVLIANTIPQLDIQTSITEGGTDDSLAITHRGDVTKNLTIKSLMDYINKHLNGVNQCFYVSTGENASDADDSPQRGKNELLPFASIKKACAVIRNLQNNTTPTINEDTADINNPTPTLRSEQYTIFVKSGDYEEDNPIYLPPNTSLIGDNLRRTTISPINTKYDILWVNSGCYVWGFTFRNHEHPAAAVAFPYTSDTIKTEEGSAYRDAFAIAYNRGHTTNGAGSSDYAIAPPSGKPLILVSPYVQGCTSYALSSPMKAAIISGTSDDPSVNDAGTGMRVDGSLVSGGIRSMVLDSFTQVNQGGIGIHLLNHGYAQLVSIFTVATEQGILCESGASCSISTSNCTFGLSGLIARGMSGITTMPNISSEWRNDPNITGTPILSGNFVIAPETVTAAPATDPYPFTYHYGYVSAADTFTITNVDGVIVNGDQIIATKPYTNLCFTVRSTNGYHDDVYDYILEGDVDPTIPTVVKELTATDGTKFTYSPRPKLFRVDLPVATTANVVGNPGDPKGFPADNPVGYSPDVPTYDIKLTYNTPRLNLRHLVRPNGTYRNFESAHVDFFARSMVETGSHTFEYMGTGTRILSSIPAYGAVANNETEAVYDSLYDPFDNLPGIVYYTSSNELGNFKVGPNFTIVQSTGTIEGDTFKRAIITLVTPLNIVLE